MPIITFQRWTDWRVRQVPHVRPQRDGQQDPGALQERPQSTTVRTGAGIMKPSKEMLPWLLSAFLCYDARQKYDVLNAQCTMKFILVYLWSSFEECEKSVTVQSSMAILNYEPRYPAVNQGFRKQRPGSSTRQRGSFRSWMTWVLWMTIKLQQVFFPKLTNPSDTRLALVALGVRKAPPPLHRSRELHGRGVRGLHRLRLGVR